ncbi:MAG: glycosyltransferase family 2 protein, partial [Gemmatimonadaceae bacterium]|nr:glycosyltransferase family 2 protein [Gemmatimonadaceae bacterium]
MTELLPVVTIITTVHDLEPYIGQCIDSVLLQTYTRWEQIVVDDGSVDGTREIVESYSDPRIRYVRLPKRGVPGLAEGYNVALSEGRGSLVAVLEGDDYWPADKLAIQVASFQDPHVQLSWGEAILVDGRGQPNAKWPRGRRQQTDMPTEQLFRELTCSNVLTPTVTVMVR